MTTNVMKLGWVLGVIAIVVGSACQRDASECEDLFIKFESPMGAAVELDSAQLVIRPSAATEFSVPREGTLSSTKATFSAVTLEPGGNVLKVTVRQKGKACTGTKSITVDV